MKIFTLYIIIGLLTLLSPIYSAEVVRYVNTGSTPGGTGITNATTGTDRAYASLSEWEAASDTDLVTAGDNHIVYCSGSTADVSSVIIDGWTTDATHDITITVASGQEHGGSWNTGVYRLITTNVGVIQCNEDYINLIGLQVQCNRQDRPKAVTWSTAAFTQNDNLLLIKDCIIRGHPDGNTGNAFGESAGIGCLAPGSAQYHRLVAVNCILYDWNYATSTDTYRCQAIQATDYQGEHVIYNCTIQNAEYGIYTDVFGAGAYTLVKNTAAMDCDDGFGIAGGDSWASNSDYNASDIASDAPGANAQNGTDATFVDKLNDDFHLSPSDAVCKDNGVNLSTDGDGEYSFSTDIDGDTRSGLWDIGADEYISISQTTKKVQGAHLRKVNLP